MWFEIFITVTIKITVSCDLTPYSLVDTNIFVTLTILAPNCRICYNSTGAPIILGRWPSLSAHESESLLRTYLVCREKQANGTWEQHTVY
jgi:hypothetical protein